MHEHAQTWSVLKSLYSSIGGTGTTSTSYAMSTVNPAIHASGTENAEPAAIGVSLQSNLQGTMTQKSLSETGMAQNTVAEIQDVNDDLSSSNSEGGNPKFMNFSSRGRITF
ncbi:PREDICTED: uncharacterized protein LOC107330931 [Acropora digitifera]|uniref:uncharacterized protein LOC107330931 n=1 Tax=Acropora digitifera TaxID=70779 RepID=UPI00077B0F8F|nr:PREDICTED: uncharacterized protein LOC107330931 [Acropora digitifera]